MGLGDKWNLTASSDAKLNKVTVISGTGSYLASLSNTAHKIVVCTSTGSGFTLDHAYLFTEDGTSKIDLGTVSAHTHTDSSDGGSVINIAKANPLRIDLSLIKSTDIVKASWLQTVTSTGAITDGGTTEKNIKLDSGATSGASATIAYAGALSCDFSSDSIFQTKIQFETATSLACHVGVNADDITAADSNTIKYQAEVCTVTNSNWWLRTASGSANSASDTGIAISANRIAIKIIHLPALPETDIYVDSSTVSLQKTSNIPVSGASTNGNLIKSSLKNNTAASRTLLNYAFRLQYETAGTWQ